MEEWFIELKAEDDEVEQWRAHFPEYGDPRVCCFDVSDGQGGTKEITGIAADSFKGNTDAQEVDEKGSKLIEGMRGWVLSSSGWSTKTEQAATGAVYRLGQDGSYRGHHFIQASMVAASVKISAVGVVVSSNGVIKRDPPKPTSAQKLFNEGSVGVLAALTYLGRTKNGDWNSLYQAFDALGKTEGLKSAGVPHKVAVRLAQTFSQYRKHNTVPMDGQPMPFHEARETLSRVIRGIAGG